MCWVSRIRFCGHGLFKSIIPFSFLFYTIGFGNYAQEASSYGPSRTTDLTGYGQYSTTAVTAATAAYATDPTLAYGASAAYGDAAGFGRGASAARGFHPYGR